MLREKMRSSARIDVQLRAWCDANLESAEFRSIGIRQRFRGLLRNFADNSVGSGEGKPGDADDYVGCAEFASDQLFWQVARLIFVHC